MGETTRNVVAPRAARTGGSARGRGARGLGRRGKCGGDADVVHALRQRAASALAVAQAGPGAGEGRAVHRLRGALDAPRAVRQWGTSPAPYCRARLAVRGVRSRARSCTRSPSQDGSLLGLGAAGFDGAGVRDRRRDRAATAAPAAGTSRAAARVSWAGTARRSSTSHSRHRRGRMAFDAFLKLDGIPGDSTDQTHKGEIDVMSFSWGESQRGRGPRAEAAGAARARSRSRTSTSGSRRTRPRRFSSRPARAAST